jgi:hypothetical protein
MKNDSTLTKLTASLPWLLRYPFWRANKFLRTLNEHDGVVHLILIVANHFEPGYNEEPNEAGGLGIRLDWNFQQKRLDDWCLQARKIGEAVRDHEGTPFRHTNFYPAEQYHKGLLEQLAGLQAEGFGEVEIHLHHGVEFPDTAENFRKVLVEFRDIIAYEHRCLSWESPDESPRYAFVHGNWALGNSAGGKWCGVDSELQILADTGCYADLTLPSAPHISQVRRINAIYTAGNDLMQRSPHRSGPSVRVNDTPLQLPILITGPLLFDWSYLKFGMIPRLENSAITANYPLTTNRLSRLSDARISVEGKPDWVFIKMYCHGFFDQDQPAVIGQTMREALEQILELAERTRKFKLHFATAREAFNMIAAATEGYAGEPGLYRDHKLKQFMDSAASGASVTEKLSPPINEVLLGE